MEGSHCSRTEGSDSPHVLGDAAPVLRGLRKAAKQAQREARTALKKSAKDVAAQAKLEAGALAEEVAAVKPVAGRLPVNHEFAGEAFPSQALPVRYRAKGLRFTREGYPDFAPYAQKLKNGKVTVEIEYTGRTPPTSLLPTRMPAIFTMPYAIPAELQRTGTQAEGSDMATSWPAMERRGRPVDDAAVARFEQQIGHRLPDDYRRFLLEVNGGRLAESARQFSRGVVNQLFSLDDDNESRDLIASISDHGHCRAATSCTSAKTTSEHVFY